LFLVVLFYARGQIIGGKAPYQYQYIPSLLQLPPTVSMLNGHGLAIDNDGFIFFTFQPTEVDENTRVLVRFAPNGTGAVLLGSDNTLAYGVPHGLEIQYENGTAFLYHSNNAHTVFKTTMSGDIVWTNNATAAWSNTTYWPYKPTWTIVPPGSQSVYVSDGYGSSYVHELDVASGKYTGVTFGGFGNGTSPQQFDCPHGIYYDPRFDMMVVSDRANSRLEYINLNGTHVRTISMGPGTPLAAAGALPCNVDVRSNAAVVPSLDGPMGILDENFQILSVIPVSTLLGPKCPHPHHAKFLPNGDIVLCCWNPGALTYWKLIS